MKTGPRRRKGSVANGDLYRAFLDLDRDHRRDIALRILRNQRMLADLYDHFLIQSSLSEPGKNVPWTAYLEHRGSRAF